MAFPRSSQEALSQNMRESYGFPAVPLGGPRRKHKEVMWFCQSPQKGASAKRCGNPMVFLLSPQGRPERKLEEILWFSFAPP